MDDRPATRRERREQALADALHGLLRDLVQSQFPSAASQAKLPLSLQLQVDPADDWAVSFPDGVLEQLAPQMEAALSPDLAFCPGAVFHFQEGTVRHPDARPPAVNTVFAGYDTMGAPRWEPLAEGESLQVQLQSGRSLRSEQLSSRGRASHDYAILGQVSCGLFPLPDAYAAIAGGKGLAISFQAVETRDVRDKFDLRLNCLAGGLLPDELDDLLEEPAWQWLGAARDAAERALESAKRCALEARKRKDGGQFQGAMRQVPGILRELADRIERGPGA